MKSWRTTVWGVAIIVQALSGAAVAVLDDDEQTKINWVVTGTAISAGCGLIKARDEKQHKKDAEV